ncbi:multi-sensor signal transduction histidine kinase [Sulfuricella denitrificans skB26]|uniref:Sensor protein n=1 Tax=Sulfuricella denitrificans (strain DSM 22764 / NBRC 105220 / skB26) TaxID=1163617 RepID=S6AIJ4_SULDS|nr:heavy metal sensor histidine kinase [Sulfuricella denitrificans]BAN36061.1 multi-sensor signal transduction histidine kinase [Sulfuricella denitrificans skB26]
MKNLSLTARISLLFAASACLVLLVAGYFLTQAVETHFREEDRRELNGKIELIQNLFEHAYSQKQSDLLTKQLDDALVGHHGLAVAVADATGDVWFATPGADFPRTLLQNCQTQSAGWKYGTLLQWKQAGLSYRGIAVSITAGSGKSYAVAVALDIQHHELFMNKFQSVLALAIFLSALATASLGWIATRWGLSPLRQVTDMVASISAEHLAERLPATDLPTELRPLVIAFNAMLARLDDSFRRLSEFSSDIAHELRTPISNLMTQTQVALSSARNNDEYKEVLYSSLEEYERMAQMVGDMLFLAQTDNGLLKPGLEKVNLANETQDLFDYFEAWAEERAVTLSRTGSVTVHGDRLMLRRALSNLISNAIRHTSQGHTVQVSLARHGDKANVSIENPGMEIPAAHLPRLFDRFYRVDPSRQRKGDGAGLGLAIVKSIVEAHGGSITVTSANQRTQFQLTLPAVFE